MRILVTGGTGFVGSHAVAALLRAGHDVRLLVRDPRRIEPALRPLGIGGIEHRVGDVRDEGSVTAAMDGVDAVLHAAAVYSIRRWHAGRVRRTNVRATEIVLGSAVAAGLDPIVHVSSYVAQRASGGAAIAPGGPLASAGGPYTRSKAASEAVARRHQSAGAPVVVVSPGMVWGPQDPHRGESIRLARDILGKRIPLRPPGGMPLVDVRDLAAALAATFEAGRGPRAYMVGGRHVAMDALMRGVGAAAGRDLRVPPLAPRPVVPLFAQMLEAFAITPHDPRTDDARARTELGFVPRPVEETLADTVAWMAAEGIIDARATLAAAPS